MNMRLPQSVAYALHATLRLAEKRHTSPVPCSRLAESGQMPERFLLQILRDLTKEGILVSSRGGGGGFSLLRDPSTVSLLELVEAVEGPMTAKLPASGFSPESQETLQRALQKIADITREQLAAIKLSHLLESPRDAMEYSV